MADLEDVDVIDWDEAMQQCGDDEEFLRELLGDLRDETDSQMAAMDEIIEVRSAFSSQERDLVFVAVGLLWIRRNGLHSHFGFGPSHRYCKFLFYFCLWLFPTDVCQTLNPTKPPIFRLAEYARQCVCGLYSSGPCHQGSRIESNVRAAPKNGHASGNYGHQCAEQKGKGRYGDRQGEARSPQGSRFELPRLPGRGRCLRRFRQSTRS